jgi:hypothetical protein
MNEMELRQEICRVGRSLFERGYVHSTAGNISVRLAEGFLITPSEACLGFLKPDVLARVGADGVQLSGDRASKTLTLHRRIYAADPDAACGRGARPYAPSCWIGSAPTCGTARLRPRWPHWKSWKKPRGSGCSPAARRSRFHPSRSINCACNLALRGSFSF